MPFSSALNLIPIGAQVSADGTRYRVWAPEHDSISVTVDSPVARRIELSRDQAGYWSGTDPWGRAGDRYRFRLPDGRDLPDPATRFQPDGVHGASECIDHRSYAWECPDWRRPRWTGQVTYELHIGTFTPEGTFRAAIGRLDHIRDLGAEVIEIMPLGDFPGGRNWGYDGVCLYAPARCYGRPDDLRALVDAAHVRGLMVILDVVYNHLGPVGNYLPAYSPAYFHRDASTPWGTALNLDGSRSKAVREFLIGNGAAWLDDYRIDGLRVDATHAIIDRSPRHLLAELSAMVHSRGGFLIAEDDRNTTEILHHRDGRGCHFDAAWADDFHHQVRVALTQTKESYYASYRDSVEDLAMTLDHGWRYRGQSFPFWRGLPRGEPCRHLPTTAFVCCIENHDQVGNRARGERLEHLIPRAAFRAATLLVCLGPYAPLLFMGQEWASNSPFLFFTDHEGDVGRGILAGRKEEFRNNGLNLGLADVPDPQARESFDRSKLDWETMDAAMLEFSRACLAERRMHLPLSQRERGKWEAGMVGEALVIRYFALDGDRALVFMPNSYVVPRQQRSLLSLGPDQCWRMVLDSGDPAQSVPVEWRGEFTGPGAVWLQACDQGVLS